MSEYPDRYRNQKLVLIIAPVGRASDPTYTCGICGFVMNEVGECPRCKLAAEERVGDQERETESLIDEIEGFLPGQWIRPTSGGSCRAGSRPGGSISSAAA